MKTKFIHLRDRDANGRALGTGGGTVAYQVDDSGFVVRSAASLCHPKDNFSRYLGRVKAEGRLHSKNYCVNYMDVTLHEKEFVQELRAQGLDLLRTV
jgi:hypothetical protein